MTASSLFLRTAALLGLAGMGLGIYMGAAHDFTLKGVHVHVNLLGFVAMFLFGLFYRLVPRAEGMLAFWHYGSAVVGLALMIVGLTGMFRGYEAFTPFVVSGSLVSLAAMGLFTLVIFRATAMRLSAHEPAPMPVHMVVE